jgi:hypothetical protein
MATDTRNTSNNMRLSNDTRPWVITLLVILGALILGYIAYAMSNGAGDYSANSMTNTGANTGITTPGTTSPGTTGTQ